MHNQPFYLSDQCHYTLILSKNKPLLPVAKPPNSDPGHSVQKCNILQNNPPRQKSKMTALEGLCEGRKDSRLLTIFEVKNPEKKGNFEIVG